MLPPNPPALIASQPVCPTDVTQLVPLLLRDLPSYANRVIVRARSHPQFQSLPTVIWAAQAEYAPLPVIAERSLADPNLKQFFFTTLERQRVGDHMQNFQQYHWVLMTPTDAGWQIALSYTRTGIYPQTDQPITPPRESSQGAIAQAAKLWLRDCHVGTIRPVSDAKQFKDQST